MEKSIKVRFERNGAGFGFGNSVGSCAEISNKKFKELTEIGKKAKTKIVVEISDSEYDEYLNSLPEPKKIKVSKKGNVDLSEALEQLKLDNADVSAKQQKSFDDKLVAMQKTFDDKLNEWRKALHELGLEPEAKKSILEKLKDVVK